MNTSLKSSLLAITAVGLLGTTVASAATVSGHITRIDRPAHKLVLRHRVYHLANKLLTAGLHHGEHVRLTYHWSKGHRWATAITPVAGKVAATHHKTTKHTSMLGKIGLPVQTKVY